MSTQIHPTSHFHVDLAATGETEESLTEKLKAAGLDVTNVRAVSALNNGISVTQLLAQGEWDHATGVDSCNEGCREEPLRHIAYADLTESQAAEIQRDMTKGMEYYRSNMYEVRDGVFSESFDSIAIEHCEHCE